MIRASDRSKICPLIREAVNNGARLTVACTEVGISARTYQRWQTRGENGGDDLRPSAVRPTPGHKLTEAERQQILAYANSPEYQSLPPGQIVPKIADKGVYIASESTFYRVLREAKLNKHRGKRKKPTRREPTSHVATAPNQVWMWDITWLKGPVKGMFYYLYLVIDLYSRKVVAFEIHESESGEHASELIQKAVLREKIAGKPLVLHADNGSPMKAALFRETLHNLGIMSSYSRPRVSNDNAYIERWFGTAKYHPSFPSNGFGGLSEAREWCLRFVRWYNESHQHSAIEYVTPGQRHTGKDEAILANRRRLWEKARQRNPRRWTGKTRAWRAKTAVTLNPMCPQEMKVA